MTPPPALLLCAFLYGDPVVRQEALESLSTSFGPTGGVAEPYPFTYTRYYREEMGDGLEKQIVSFLLPVHPGLLPRLKLASGRTEDAMRDPSTGRRRVNLDPGYLTPSALVLASTKGAPHRIYLGLGIYGETTLVYDRGEYRPLPWTYPDFRQEGVIRFLGEARRGILRRRRGTIGPQAAGGAG